MDTTPIHPYAEFIQGSRAYPTLAETLQTPEALSIVTRPEVTRDIIEQALQLGIRYVEMPGLPSSKMEVAFSSRWRTKPVASNETSHENTT